MLACVLVDADRRYEVVYGTPAWVASLEWARFHGIDPMGIPAGSEVIRDEHARRITFTAFVKSGPEVADIVIVDGEAVTRVCVEQGEAPPLRLPIEVTG